MHCWWICGQNHSVGIHSIRRSKMSGRYKVYISWEDQAWLSFSRSLTAIASGPHALKEYMSAVVAVAARNCSLLLTSHPCCISAQTLIRTNGTRVYALRNTEREILHENVHEQRPERDPGTDTFYPGVSFRACSFIRVVRHIFILYESVELSILLLHLFQSF